MRTDSCDFGYLLSKHSPVLIFSKLFLIERIAYLTKRAYHLQKTNVFLDNGKSYFRDLNWQM